MSVNVALVVALVKLALSSLSNTNVIVGVPVPLTPVQCIAAYMLSVAATAPNCIPVLDPVAVMSLSISIVPLTTLSVLLLLLTVNGVTSPIAPSIE